jgi:regulator of RNase E activity RraA
VITSSFLARGREGPKIVNWIKESTKMNLIRTAFLASVLSALMAPPCHGQLGLFSKEQLIEFTREWKGERFEDGRPRVPDQILERMKSVSAEEAWTVLRNSGYLHQFESGWQQFNQSADRMVGRAVTAVFMPIRPEVNAVINDHAKAEGRVSSGQNSWVIDTLKPMDLMVVDLFGKVAEATIIGDNLGTSVYTKTGTGVVINGGVRDLTGLREIKGFTGYVRGFHPSESKDIMLMGINVPIRIGNTTVMPGDVILGDPEGVMFIPAHLAQKVVEAAEEVHLRDEWSHMRLREGKYTPGQVDTRWTEEMREDFRQWAEKKKAGVKR